MSEINVAPTPKKRSGWLHKLVWIAGILIVLLVVVYFVATSSAFLKGVILPKVSKALGADVTVADAQISPFSHVLLRDLKVQPPGGEPVLAVQEIHANYSLWSIIGGNLAVSEVVIESPVVTVVENADGTCNLDVFTKANAQEARPATPAAPKNQAPARPPQIDIKKVALNNATVRLVKKYANGGQDVIEVTGLNFAVNDLKNGQSGKIELAAAMAVQKAAQTNAAAASLSAKLLGGFDFAMTPDLKPGSVKGSTTFTVSQATGPLADLNAFAATLNCELTPTDLKELALRLTKSDASLAEVRVSGPFDMDKTEGKLKLEISGIDRRALNLVGAASGMDFGTTTFNCTNDIELTKGGKAISLAGRFDLAHLQVIQKNQTSPTLDLHSDYAVTVDQAASSAVLQTLNLTGTQDSRTFLQMGLSNPMTVGWDNASSAVGDATLNLIVTNLNLADWKPFAGDSAPGGTVNLVVKLVSQQSGKQLAFDVDTRLDNLTTGTGNASVNQGNVHLQTSGTLADMKQLKLDNYQLDVFRQGQSLGKIYASGTFNTATSEGKIKVEISGIDRRALNIAGAASGMDFGTTTINCSNDIELAKGGNSISLAGHLNVAKLQVKRQDQTSPTLDLKSDYDVTVDRAASTAVLQTFNLAGTQDSRALLQVGLTSPMTIAWGRTSSAVGDASLTLTVTNLNLADWKAFAGDAAPGGVANVTLKLDSQKAGKLLVFALDTHLDNITTGTGSARVSQGDLRTQAQGSVADMKLIKLDNYQLDISRQGQSVMAVSGSGTFDSGTQDADLQVAVQAALAQLLAVPGASPTNCALGFKGHVTNQQKKITVTGELDLSPTARAKNTLQLNGNADASQADAITGSFKLAADSLDLTSYYDLLSSIKPAATNNQPVVTSATPASNPDQEPAAMKLPLKNFTFDLNIGRLYLREVDIANWQTTALLDGGHVVVQPCQLTLNGAPIKATTDLNLGVPGYTYDVAFDANAIPLAPLVDSFAPDRKGQIKGTTSIGVQVKGAGVTGASLKENLNGQFNFASTNMDLAIPNIRSPLITSVINVIIGIPDLIKNPTAAIGNMFGSTHKSGWTDALMSSPVDAITMQATAGDGQVKLQSAEVRSAAFQALASGQIVFAPILTNSTIEIPITVELSRSLAGQIGLVDANTPANAAYVALPNFLTEEGTIGQPHMKKDDVALMELAAKVGGGIAGKIGGAGGQKAGSALNAIEGLFGGGKSTTKTNSTATTTNKSSGGILNFFKKLQ